MKKYGTTLLLSVFLAFGAPAAAEAQQAFHGWKGQTYTLDSFKRNSVEAMLKGHNAVSDAARSTSRSWDYGHNYLSQRSYSSRNNILNREYPSWAESKSPGYTSVKRTRFSYCDTALRCDNHDRRSWLEKARSNGR